MIGDRNAGAWSPVVVRIEPPDFETRCELLRRRAAATRQAVPEPVIAYIAERIKTNVRELEGCLLKLVAYTSLLNQPITLALARQALEDHLNQTRKILTVSDIESSVATYFGLTPADLHTSRDRPSPWPTQLHVPRPESTPPGFPRSAA
jgi:chromosomal replication initiator protein